MWWNDVCWRCLKCDGDNLDDYKCYGCDKCGSKSYPSWNNLKYHIPVIRVFTKIKNNIEWKVSSYKENKNYISDTETKDMKFIWGIKSWDDLSGHEANLFTMNDIDVTYDKKRKKYYLGLETAYTFEEKMFESDYLRDCLDAFTKYMNNNGLSTNKQFSLFFNDPCTTCEAESIEELYMNFKIFVDGYSNNVIYDEGQ